MEKIKKISAREQTLKAIRNAVFKGDLKAGEEITQNGIAEMLNVSRMPVREAFQELHKEGIIQIQNNRRVTVVGLTKADVEDHYEIRALLEGLASQKACDYPDSFDQIKQIHSEIKASSEENFVKLNEQFHFAIWEASNSKRLYYMLKNLWNGLQPQFPSFVQFQAQKSLNEHEEIVHYITKQDKTGAFNSTKNHVLRTKNDFLETVNLQ